MADSSEIVRLNGAFYAAEEITSEADVVRKVQMALQAASVEFLNHGRPGVRLQPHGEA